MDLPMLEAVERSLEQTAAGQHDRWSRAGPPAGRAQELTASAEQAASGIGNRQFTQLIARMREGEGILQGGLVHPDVEAAIAASRSGGRPLEPGSARDLEEMTGGTLQDVRLHIDQHAAALARAVSARAFTVGNDIYFGSGEYNPGTRAGTALIAHEVAHVVQQRGAPLGGPLTVSQPGDALEREAEALAHDYSG